MHQKLSQNFEQLGSMLNWSQTSAVTVGILDRVIRTLR